jgi:hypothetical protein
MPTVFSNGQWAKAKDRFHDEESVTSTWTTTSPLNIELPFTSPDWLTGPLDHFRDDADHPLRTIRTVELARRSASPSVRPVRE